MEYLIIIYVIATLIIIYQQARDKKKLRYLLDKLREGKDKQ
ncbi:hypothetical protein C8R30_101152 [Nitrosomonas nitrosa]|nr:hypothetical protein C8R30_101152 [Nitrosomonas nitrosa]